ncbi:MULTISPECIES: dihydrolipoamide acetyltransferase family protein [Streptomyces]|uniref:Dihydrolipoamide acetyltransferase component of pyruvate dehydrogenase complex n=2 Tax=Streptomyces TaxID=1883 RepID=A0ABT9LH04_STRGD|nr:MULTISPECIES: dihydrolipoamide acetyltransferase family protein [Streptomyces]MDP9682990.1 pyruvate dehydrogenase E2 component (dihydrolipoamide acetyltransferase) [Streptomyces griseoviridis]GGS90160.1 dihydrolipoamide acetyltransferase component of pyruvate dehydrogenase complex [Streptomyces griseoviridis]GGU68809.1 dihydrolipoamide acetyltransferase component of pyruvate dehydrogenase complex [Streptomyces daghestanicus]GHI32622.1 dihydrolipoamide acetyltransferase component of pyruvate 
MAAQVREFRLPDLGEGLTGAEIVRWMVEVGEVVAVDQPVVEVETAKAMVEVPCPYGGVVTARFGAEGTEVPVGAPLLTVAVGETGGAAAGGTPADGASATGASPGGADGTPAAEDTEGSGNVLVGYGTARAPARRRRVRPGVPVSAAAVAEPVNGRARDAGEAAAAAGGAGGRVPEPDGGARPERGPEPAEGPVPVISPLVRRLARSNGLDLRELTGSGPDGLILRADVEYALRAAAAQGRTAAATGAPVRDGGGAEVHAGPGPAVREDQAGPGPAVRDGHRIPLKGIRGAVADKLSRSRREIPEATVWVDADATELMRARAAMNAAGEPKISLLALLARICTAALARHPELNSAVDTQAREIVRYDRVHLGFATQTDRGLVVPVVRDAHTRGAEDLTAELSRLTGAARAGTLAPADLTGSTFTLNNYGVFGVDGSTPILNHPEAAMLGVGRIVPRPWAHEGELALRQVVQLTLTFDHRVCDGGTAGGFLRYVADCVERPAVLLRTL